ncbi:MAG TPA: hypothetical protein VLW84_12030 [Terriglobales bacterium]|nr:hypothetical protein [Terriglobales bacterium]
MLQKQLLAMLAFVPICFAQNVVESYVDLGIGLAPAGFNSPAYHADAGDDLHLRRWFGEAEVGVDTADDQQTRTGFTVRAHGLFMFRATTSWRFGGGLHYSSLNTTTYTKHNHWPVVAAMYENDWFRANLEYLLPGGDRLYRLTGPLVDMSFRIAGGFFFRERVAGFAFRNPYGGDSHYHPGAEADIGLMYVFGDGDRR